MALQLLPDEILAQLIDVLGSRDLATLGSTCAALRQMANMGATLKARGLLGWDLGGKIIVAGRLLKIEHDRSEAETAYASPRRSALWACKIEELFLHDELVLLSSDNVLARLLRDGERYLRGAWADGGLGEAANVVLQNQVMLGPEWIERHVSLFAMYLESKDERVVCSALEAMIRTQPSTLQPYAARVARLLKDFHSTDDIDVHRLALQAFERMPPAETARHLESIRDVFYIDQSCHDMAAALTERAYAGLDTGQVSWTVFAGQVSLRSSRRSGTFGRSSGLGDTSRMSRLCEE